MALSMQIRPVTIPTAIKGQPNGAVDPALLMQVELTRPGSTWLMAELPARSMRALHDAARRRGLNLTSSGRGRTLGQQYEIFCGPKARYKGVSASEYNLTPQANRKYWGPIDYTSSTGLPAPGRVTVGRLLGVNIDNTSYWVKIKDPNGNVQATAAVPGTSNHGFWLADDLAKVDPSGVKPYLPFNSADLQILYELAPLYGFHWELPSENWHVHWTNGDRLTQATINYENPPGPDPSPEPEPPNYDEEMAVHLISETKGQWIWAPGSKPQPLKTPADAVAILTASGAKSASITDAQLDALYVGEAPAGLPYFPV